MAGWTGEGRDTISWDGKVRAKKFEGAVSGSDGTFDRVTTGLIISPDGSSDINLGNNLITIETDALQISATTTIFQGNVELGASGGAGRILYTTTGTYAPQVTDSADLTFDGTTFNLLGFTATALFGNLVTNWDGGDITINVDAGKNVNINGGLVVSGAISGFGVAAIGHIVAFDKSFTNTPALPAGWVECNGQTLSDSASVFNGQAMRNLNASGGGTKRFLRGSTTSGTTGGADTYVPAGTMGGPSATVSSTGGSSISAASSGHSHTFTGTSAGYLPSYMEMVWTVRVK